MNKHFSDSLLNVITFKRLLIIAISVCLTGCNPFSEPESLTDEYLSRLARVLEQQPSATLTSLPQSLPRPKQRRFELEPFKVNMLQFFALFGCELQVIAGEKNSILGKVMTPSAQLNYELRFLLAADSCLEKTKQEPELQAIINEVSEHKKQQLPKVISNAVWNTPEIAHYLSYSTDYFPVRFESNDTDVQQLIQLNNQLSKLLNNDFSTDMSILSTLQYQWQYDSSAGQLIKTVHLLTERLDQANQLMTSRLAKPICYQKKPNPKAKLMESFFFNVYIKHIQPYIANVHQHAKPVITQLAQLASLTPTPSSDFKQYQSSILSTDVNSQWHHFNKTFEQHTQFWQQLLEQCGMRPGQNLSSISIENLLKTETYNSKQG
jgi:hypothetical protein